MKSKLVIVLIGCLVAILSMFSCESPSSRINKQALTDVVIYKTDIVQDGSIVSFTKYDTTNYQVVVRKYRTTIDRAINLSDSTVKITKAYPTLEKAEVIVLNIRGQ